MNKYILKLIVLNAFVLFNINAVAQNKIQALDSYFANPGVNQQFNGNVLVAQKGKIIFERSFGYADFKSRKLNNSNSSFTIASITKMINGTAVLQLVQTDLFPLSWNAYDNYGEALARNGQKRRLSYYIKNR